VAFGGGALRWHTFATTVTLSNVVPVHCVRLPGSEWERHQNVEPRNAKTDPYQKSLRFIGQF
jgi:hypothetical protein